MQARCDRRQTDIDASPEQESRVTRGQEFQSSSQVVTRWYQPIIVV